MSCPVPVTTTVVNVSVMTIMARQLHCGADYTSRRSAAPLRDRAACTARRALSLGAPVRASPVTCFRTPPSCTVQSTITVLCTFARASGSVLRTTVLSFVRTHRHSIAVAAPLCRVLRRRFPFAHTKGLSFLTACRGFGSHTPRIPMQARSEGASTAQPCSKAVRDAIHGLGKAAPGWDQRRVRSKNRLREFKGLARHTPQHDPPRSTGVRRRRRCLFQGLGVFPRCACADMSMTASNRCTLSTYRSSRQARAGPWSRNPSRPRLW